MVRAEEWDFLFVTFGEPHGAGHYLWHVGDPDYPTHPAGDGAHPVRDVYVAVDAAIGAILETLDDRTTVIVTSGDGMGPNYSGCHLMPEMLHRMGHFYAGSVGGGAESTAPKKGLLATIRQSIPLELRQSVTPLPAAIHALQDEHEVDQFRHRLAAVEALLHPELERRLLPRQPARTRAAGNRVARAPSTRISSRPSARSLRDCAIPSMARKPRSA